MARYPRRVRNAREKCISCNAPAGETTDDQFVCVECGTSVLKRSTTADREPIAADD
jgi:predicted RNA-binding Zn-ribbon protein involved in translation (DUF1610 family)